MQTSPYRSFLRKYYLASALYDCIFAYAIYTVLFHIKGLSVFRISLLLAIWSFFSLIFEIPSGALSDYWSRKWMLTIAPLIKALCFVTWFFAGGSFWMYVLGFGFWSLGSACVSGTTEALLYDTLVHLGRSDTLEKVLGRKEFYFQVALSVCLISGGFLAAVNLGLPVILSVVPLLFSSFFFSRLRDVPKVGSTEEAHYLHYMRTALHEVRTNRTLLYLALYLWAIGAVWGNLEEFDQLYWELAHLPIAAFGIAGFLGSAPVALAAYHAHRLKNRPSVFWVLPAVGGIILLAVARYPSIPMIGLLLLSYMITSPLKVLMGSRVQRCIASDSRATVTSFVGFMENVSGIVIPITLGVISRIWNLQAIYLAMGMFLFVLTLWVVLVRDRISGLSPSAPGAHPRGSRCR